MSLEIIKFSVDPVKEKGKSATIDRKWSHIGVVGSGDLEILFTKSDSETVDVKIVTPVRGFDDVWKEVVERFINETALSGVTIEINDNNATPFVVALRLKQAFREALEGGAAGE